MVRAAPAAAVLVLAASLHAAGQAGPSLDLGEVMRGVAAYLRAYGEEYSATVATERYVQTAANESRTLESEFAIVKLSGVSTWLGFRDVLSVDGKPVRDREARLTRLFGDAAAGRGVGQSTASQAMSIVRESARFNIGSIERTINNPALVLELLDPSHHRGFRFSKQSEEELAGVRAWRIRFVERQTPTIIQTPNGRHVPSTGEFWVDPATGRLMRVDVILRLSGLLTMPGRSFAATVKVMFGAEPVLDLWVPVRMLEEYVAANGPTLQKGDASYTNYRRFRVESRVISLPATR